MLARVGYRLEGTRYIPRHLLEPEKLRRLEFDDVICRHMFEFGQNCVFIQIGAYDGVSTDPLCKYIKRCGWRGVMLEPQPRPAGELRERYRGNEGIVVLEAALDRERGVRSFYTIESDTVPKWAGGMASFRREHLLKQNYLIEGIEGMVRELKVHCIPFNDVLDHLSSGRLDLLQIDAEGADGYIISLFPFDRIRPAIIHWEIKNMTRREKESSLDRVTSYGYRIAPSGHEDMLAVRAL